MVYRLLNISSKFEKNRAVYGREKEIELIVLPTPQTASTVLYQYQQMEPNCKSPSPVQMEPPSPVQMERERGMNDQQGADVRSLEPVEKSPVPVTSIDQVVNSSSTHSEGDPKTAVDSSRLVCIAACHVFFTCVPKRIENELGTWIQLNCREAHCCLF